MPSARILLAGLALACLLALGAQPAQALVAPGKPMPAMVLPDTTGQSHNLAEMIKDKVAMVVYWSVSCPHCQQQMPSLLAVARRLEGNPFVLVLINTDGQAMAKAVEGYANEHRMPAPIIMDVGPKDSVPFADFFDIVATPGVLVFDRQGRLVQAQELEIDLNRLQKALEAGF